MTEWKEYKLGEIATFISEKVSVKDISVENYISTENMVSDKGGITVATNKPLDGTITKYYPNNILVSNIRPYFKKIWFSNRDGGCSNDVLCFEANTKYINPKYLYFLLSQDLFFDYVMLGSKGCKMPRGDKSHIMNWDISLPPLPEQIRIASILSSLDDKIDLLHRENKTLEAMAETLFRQWFIEEAKEDWKEGKLGDVVDVIDNRGKTPPYIDNITEYPIIEVNAITGKERYVKYNLIRKYVVKNIYDTWFRGYFHKYDILIATVGSIGELAMCLEEKGVIAQNIIALHAKNISPFYLYQYLLYNQDDLKCLDIGSVQPSIKVPHLLRMPIVIPSSYILNEYDMLMINLLEKENNNLKQIKTLTQQRDSLLPKLMSGEVKI